MIFMMFTPTLDNRMFDRHCRSGNPILIKQNQPYRLAGTRLPQPPSQHAVGIVQICEQLKTGDRKKTSRTIKAHPFPLSLEKTPPTRQTGI